MKKLTITLLILQATTLVGCGARTNPAATGLVNQPGAALGGGQTYTDPNQYAGGGSTYTDPTYGGGTGYADPTYGGGTGYTDPSGGYGQPGAGTGYDTGYGAGTGTGYGQGGYGQGGGVYDPNNPYGQPGAVDPVTGQPIMGGINPQLDPGVTQRIVSAIQSAGGYKGLSSDNKAIEIMKSMGMPMQQAFANSPLEHRALIIKSLLHGWAGSDEKNYARQIWATVMPQDQQRLMSSDPTLSDLVTKKISSGGGSSSSGILSSIGKLIGLG